MLQPLTLLLCLHLSFTQYVLGNEFEKHRRDLTLVKWEHGVNSKEAFEAALKGNATMLEADIVLGHVDAQSQARNDPKVPIMAHPPETVSNFTLRDLVDTYVSSGQMKGLKLDFKSRDAFAYSERTLDALLSFDDDSKQIWLNADIIPGPVDASKDVMDADYFLTTCISRYPTAIISVGWSTKLEPGSTGQYTQKDLDQMTEALNRNMVMTTVTFAVRAALAAKSVDLLHNLVKSSSSEWTTLTVWSSPTDEVDVKGLRELVNKVGRDRVYLDLPEPLMEKLLAKDTSSASSISMSTFALMAAVSVYMLLFFNR